jgi:acyl-coenzyme A synthetase/AMP-(fatty) acid ligase
VVAKYQKHFFLSFKMTQFNIASFSRDVNRVFLEKASDVFMLVGEDTKTVKYTYEDVGRLVEQNISYLVSQNLRAGDTLVSLLPNSPEAVIIFLAAMKMGLQYAPFPCETTIYELNSWNKVTKPKLFLATSHHSPHLNLGDVENCSQCLHLPLDGNFSWCNKNEPFHDLECSSSLSRILISTSGSTGEPKAMVISGDRLWSSALAFSSYHGMLDSSPRFWNYLPFSYLGGLFNLCLIPLASKGSILIDETFSGKKFLQFWQTIERFEIDSLWFVPTILRGLLKIGCRGLDMARCQQLVKRCFLGTAPISLEEKQAFKDTFGIDLFENFALSETTFFTSENLENLQLREPSSVGSKLPYVEVDFVDAPTKDSPQEILVKSPYMFLGYLGQNGDILSSVDERGFFPTGDLGYFNRGQLIIAGRKRDIIKKGGYLIALTEIENYALRHKDVVEAAAVKKNHPFYGESYCLYLTVSLNFQLNDFSCYLHDVIAKHKWPDKVIVVNEFPKTSSGKIRKHLIEDLD